MKLGTLREFLTHFPEDLDVVVRVMDNDEHLQKTIFEIDHVGVAIIDGMVEIYGTQGSTQDNN